MTHLPIRLTVDKEALVANWRWLASASGPAKCGAAIKADAYGTGAAAAAQALVDAGCRDFFVAIWDEASAALPHLGDASLSVLHGVGHDDMPAALQSRARPVLNSPEQVRRWRETGRPCDVMVDTGMNRLGISIEDIEQGLLDGLEVEILMSHLACADEDGPVSERQLSRFAPLTRKGLARRYSLANSAGICLGSDYAFDLTRPGIALYGGTPRREAAGRIAQVVRIEAQVLQRRQVPAGEGIGYNHLFTPDRACELAILNIGYADGYLRGFSNKGSALIGGRVAPVVGRVSMDLTAVCVDAAPEIKEGDWIEIDFDLPRASANSGLSQYELLTVLGRRYRRTGD